MNTEPSQIFVKNIPIEIVKKNIKHIHVGVYPPNGSVRVSAPIKMAPDAIRLFVITKINWVERQQSKFNLQARESARQYVSGESHYFLGNRYRLNVIFTNSTQKSEIANKSFINLYVKANASTHTRETIMDRFYRKELRKALDTLITKWQRQTGIKIQEVQIKKMKTRWGTCNSKQGRIWVNQELAKKPLRCLEYVLIHEMTHLLERNHTEKFSALLNSFMPQWQSVKEELSQYPLSYN